MLLCLTANHQNASFELLESLSTGAQAASAALVERGDLVNGAVVLATCNRFEAYLDIDEPLPAARTLAVEATFEALAAASGVTTRELRDQVTVLCDDAVPAHLFAVTSGLESVVVGEDEISGQVSRALGEARIAGTTSSSLERLFQRASHTSRGVKNRTAIGGAGRSLVRLALEMTSSRVTDWARARVLVVGTGQYAGTTVAALHDRGVTDITVFSPTGRGAAFATKHGLALSEQLTDAVAATDIVITCTAALAVTPENIPDGARRILIDLGLPRNIDPAVGTMPGVELLDLEIIRLHAPLEELSAADDARELVGAAAATFAAETEIEPAIVALRGHIFDLLDAEIARNPGSEAALRHFAGVLLHGPSVRARELALDGRSADVTAALRVLYGLDVELGRESRDGLATA